MSITLQTLKPVNKLHLDDFDKYKIWQFATDNEGNNDLDETWVRPLNSKVIPWGSYNLTVASRFKTSSGHEFSGFVSVSTDRDINFGVAIILYLDHYIVVPTSEFWNADIEYSQIAQSLGLTITEFLPLQFKLTVLLEGESELREGYIV